MRVGVEGEERTGLGWFVFGSLIGTCRDGLAQGKRVCAARFKDDLDIKFLDKRPEETGLPTVPPPWLSVAQVDSCLPSVPLYQVLCMLETRWRER